MEGILIPKGAKIEFYLNEDININIKKSVKEIKVEYANFDDTKKVVDFIKYVELNKIKINKIFAFHKNNSIELNISEIKKHIILFNEIIFTRELNIKEKIKFKLNYFKNFIK